ncbi:F0F1 ATP synthase subunit epsilon [Microbacterium sp. A82]|uniref:F0F1 ATP synthase subunit epsilon n=1 Tax=unclassified Microbacterium TaxID=2609290 RepID=UPI003F3A86AB
MALGASSLKVSLVSADAEVWTGEATLVVAKTVEGEIGIMPGHEPILAILAEGQVRITELNGTKVLANAQDGFLSMDRNQVTIVAGNAALIA